MSIVSRPSSKKPAHREPQGERPELAIGRLLKNMHQSMRQAVAEALRRERIELTLIEGPFETFVGSWSFRALNGQASKVELHLEFEMSGRLLNFAARKMFDGIANQMVDALVKRAYQLFGGTR